MMLADLGADVIRIDRPGGDGLQVVPPEDDLLGRGRPSAAIDLKTERGVELVLELVAQADVLIEGYRPGVAERLGLGPDACFARNPGLVYGRMTGWGQDGPLAHAAGHDINYISVAGALNGLGHAGEAPAIPMNLLGDFGGGALYLVSGVLAAVTHARQSGHGQVVDAAITDGVAHLMAMPLTMQQAGVWDGNRGTNMLSGGAPFYDVYETADGRWMSVGSLEPKFYAKLEELLETDLPDRNDVREWPQLRARLSELFAGKKQAEWIDIFEGTDACVAGVANIDDAVGHPHNVARQTYVHRDGKYQPAPAPRFSRTPAELTTPPAATGSDTRDALTAWGIDDVETLITDGVAVQK